MQLQLQQVRLTAPVGMGQVFNNLSLSIDVGDRLAILGAANSGKTALLRLLNRLTSPQSGQIQFEGRDLAEWPVNILRRQIAYVDQTPRLLGLTVGETLRYPLAIQKPALSDPELRLKTLIDAVNLPATWLDQPGAQLSISQQQFVAIARALILQPKVLLLDAPLATLAPAQLRKILAGVNYITPKTTVVLTSRESEGVAEFCNRYLLLDQGGIIQAGKMTESDRDGLKQLIDQIARRDDQDWQSE
ncbi:MAG: ATP-binding cassette domain-containing protein [Cyanobacteria bacterium P01_D01_bin.128]